MAPTSQFLAAKSIGRAGNYDIYAYTRTLDDEVVLVLLNFSANAHRLDINALVDNVGPATSMLLDNYAHHAEASEIGYLRAYQAQVIKL